MSNSRIPSPARSQGSVTPRRHKPLRTRSVGSPARSTTSGRLSSVIQFKENNKDSFALSPVPSRRSVLNDDTYVEEPRRRSWWKKLGENSRDIMEVLDENKITGSNEAVEEYIDIEVLSQEKKNYTIDLPDSSDSESISSIVIPQRKLFTQKDLQAQIKFGKIVGTRETLAKLQKSNVADKTVNVAPKNLFNQNNRMRNKPVFPAALLNVSPNKTMNKTKEMAAAEVKGQVRTLFGNRGATKRKNMFADFIVSESEDEIPDIQPKVFGFQKNMDQRRDSPSSRGKREHSPTSSITTDIEMDEWQHLPSSTMVENQIEGVLAAAGTPVKRPRLSELEQIKESVAEPEAEKESEEEQELKYDDEAQSDDNNEQNDNQGVLNEDEANRCHNLKDNDNMDLVQEENNDQNLSKTTNKSKLVQNLTRESNKTSNKSRVLNESQKKSSISDQNKTKAAVDEVDNQNKSLKEIQNNSRRSTKTNEAHNTSQKTNNEIKENNTDIKNKDNHVEPNTELEMELQTQNMCENGNKVPELTHNAVEAPINQAKEQPNEDEQNEFETVKDHLENVSKSKHGNTSNKDMEIEANNGDEIMENLETSVHPAEEEKLEESENEIVKEIDKSLEKSQKENEELKDNNEEEEHEQTQIESEVEAESEVEIQEEEENEQENDEDQIDNVSAVQDESQMETEENEQEDEEENKQENEVEENDDSQNEMEVPNESEAEVDEDEKEIEQSQIQSDEEEKQKNDAHDEAVESEAEAASDDEMKVQNASEPEASDEENVVQENSQIESEEENNESNANAQESMVESQEENDESNREDQVSEEESQNESEELHYETETEEDAQNESQEDAQNESQEDAQNESQEDAQNESNDDAQNESNDDAQNETHADDQYESEDEEEIKDTNEPDEIQSDNAETPNVSHDTTGRNRSKPKDNSPEAILHDKTNQIESFVARGRNTSIRKSTLLKNLNIKPSLAPPRESTGMSDGTRNSSVEGSGWDSHRTTRKTLRQTFGKDFTPRKSLRAMVMEKSAKRQTAVNDTSVTSKFPQANSTELPGYSIAPDDDEIVEESNHDVSKRTRQTTLEMYLQKIKRQNIEKKQKMEEAVRNSLKAPSKDILNPFKVPSKPMFASRKVSKPAQSKPKKQTKPTMIPLDDLPDEVVEDMKYKPPKRFQPSNAAWITKRLYKFLESKLESKYDYKARVRAEKLVANIYHFAKDLRRVEAAPQHSVDALKQEMARLDVVKTHFDFYQFFHEYMPREIRVKVVPDVVNKIGVPRHGVFSDILRGNTVQG